MSSGRVRHFKELWRDNSMILVEPHCYFLAAREAGTQKPQTGNTRVRLESSLLSERKE